MKLKYKTDYFSIKVFEPIELENFSILTGLNGSGKTHLLEAIKKDAVEIEGIDKSEIVYYNYNDFTVYTGEPSQNSIYTTKLQSANTDKAQLMLKLNEKRQQIIQNAEGRKATDQIIISFSQQPNFVFSSWLGHERDYDALRTIEDNILKGGEIKSHRDLFTGQFFNFISQYLMNGHGNIGDIQYDLIKLRFENVDTDIQSDFKSNYSEDYDFIRKLIPEKNIFEINEKDLESPDFFLLDIANEEKEYRILQTQNSLNKVQADEWGHKLVYMGKDDFIKTHGFSPIEQINEVLNEYDCNGYYLTSNQNQIPLGQDKNSFKIQINLKHNEPGYQTTFDKLSSGEKTLIALALLIYKSKKKKIIPRVLLLDEIDSSLHPTMIKRLLSVIENLFVNKNGIKVILVTHSPTTVALSPNNSIYIVQQTGQKKVTKAEKSNAIKFLTEGFATLNQEDSDLSIGYNISKTKLSVLFTEGITDKIILEIAWKKLKSDAPPLFYIQDCFDAKFLKNLLSRGHEWPDGIFVNYSDKIFIAIFDFDNEGYNSWHGLKVFTEEEDSRPDKCLTKVNNKENGYALLLPVPKNEDILKQVMKNDTETFKQESKLPIELMFYGVPELENYFYKETVIGAGEIIQFRGKKRDFAQSLNHLAPKHFEVFNPLFDKLESIINSKREQPFANVVREEGESITP